MPYRFMKLFSILILITLLSLSGCTQSSKSNAQTEISPPRMAKVGFTAPDFRLKNIKGDLVSLDALRGKVVLVNFWATWCSPCRAEMPSMEELYRSFDRRDFEILAVSSDEDGLRSVKPFQEEYHFTFPLLVDETLLINDLYGVSSIPTSIIVDRKGIITNRFFGAVDWNDPRQKNLVTQMINALS